MKLKVLLIAGIMGIAAISGIAQGLTAPRHRRSRKDGEKGETKGKVQEEKS